MSDHHEPDQAALDELLRAFGEDVEPPSESGDPQETDDDADADAAVETDPPSAAAVDPLPDTGDQTDAGTRAESGQPAESSQPVESGRPADPEPPADPEVEEASQPAEIFIVEQEPPAQVDDTEPPAPTVIRIDDYSGSVVVEPAAPSPDPLLVGAAARTTDAPADPSGDTESTDSPESSEPIVISIEDQDLPDPVYVEGNLERSGNRSIVFIEDDDTGDTSVAAVDRNAQRGIEPRLRERRAAVKRAIGRKRLRWILLVSSVVIVGVAVLAVLGSSLFAIKEENVTIVGQVYADPAVVDAVVDDLVGTPALLVDTQTAEERLEAIPWVDEARVRVDFPHTATIEIREREAMTTYQGPDQRYRVLDREGRVLDVLDGWPIAYVLLNGPDPVDLEPGQFAPQGYAAASDLAKTLTSSVRGQVAFVDVTASGSTLNLYLDDGTIVRFGAARDLLDKLIRLETVLTNNPEREPGVIDVSTSEVTL